MTRYAYGGPAAVVGRFGPLTPGSVVELTEAEEHDVSEAPAGYWNMLPPRSEIPRHFRRTTGTLEVGDNRKEVRISVPSAGLVSLSLPDPATLSTKDRFGWHMIVAMTEDSNAAGTVELSADGGSTFGLINGAGSFILKYGKRYLIYYGGVFPAGPNAGKHNWVREGYVVATPGPADQVVIENYETSGTTVTVRAQWEVEGDPDHWVGVFMGTDINDPPFGEFTVAGNIREAFFPFDSLFGTVIFCRLYAVDANDQVLGFTDSNQITLT